MVKFKSSFEQFNKTIETWMPLREKTIQDLTTLKENLGKKERKAKFEKRGGGAAIASGAAIIAVGAVLSLSPMPIGGLLLIAAGGAVVGVGGVAAGVGIRHKNIPPELVKKSQDQYDCDQSALQEAIKKVEEIRQIIYRIQKRCPNNFNDILNRFIRESMQRIVFKEVNETEADEETKTLEDSIAKCTYGVSSGMLKPNNISEEIQSTKDEEIQKLNRFIDELAKQKEAVEKDLKKFSA